MDAKKLKIANIVCWGIVVVLAIVLGVLVSTSKNYVVTKDLESVQSSNGSSSSQASSGSDSSSQSGGSSGSGGSSSSSGSSNSSGKSSTQDSDESIEERLTMSIKAEGYDTVVKGVVKAHGDQYTTGTTAITYYVRLDEPATISGYQTTHTKTESTQTLCASSINKRKNFSSEQDVRAFFYPYVGKTVLVGLKSGDKSVQFASGTSCSFTLHSSNDCDLMNYGHVVYLSDFDLLALN